MKRSIFNIKIIFFIAFAIPGFAQEDSIVTKKELGVPVIYKKDTLFSIFAKLGSFKPAERVDIIERRINGLAELAEFNADSLKIEEEQQVIHVVVVAKSIFIIV